MKIAFDLFGCGLSNNGGSRTIIRSANTLVGLGHEVYIFSHCQNQNTWDELKAQHEVNKYPFHFPNVDVLVATGAGTALHTVEFPYKKVGVYWIRGIEVWAKPLKYLIQTYNMKLHLMVNSEWQKDFVSEKVYEKKRVDIQYPGLELDFYKPKEKSSNDFIIGGLFHPARHKGWYDFEEIVSDLPGQIHILSATATVPSRDLRINKIFANPSEEKKRSLYQSCDVWLATTHLDGLHLPPMEAGLCGATLIANGMISSGMSDHAIHRETAMVYNNIEFARDCIQVLSDSHEYRKELNENHRKLLKEKMGTREFQMGEMVKKFSSLL